MKVIWHSSPPIGSWTGYSKQSYHYVKAIQSLGHQVIFVPTSAYEWGRHIQYDGIDYFPRGWREWGQDGAEYWSKRWKADAVFSLMDIWVLDADFGYRVGNWYPMVPVDHDPLPPVIKERLEFAKRPIAYSLHGKQKMIEAGLNPYYLPHGVNTGIFKPMPKSKAVLGVDDKMFVVGMVAANIGRRKCYEQAFEAFAKFHCVHPDSVLYCHTVSERIEGGLELNNMAKSFGIEVMFPNRWMMAEGIPDTNMARIYNSFDVLLAASRGEGFGIPILEAQACGVPAITTDFTAMTELNFAGLTVDSRRIWTELDSWQAIPDVPQMIDRLEQVYETTPASEKLVERAREYDWQVIVEKHLKPILEDIGR